MTSKPSFKIAFAATLLVNGIVGGIVFADGFGVEGTWYRIWFIAMFTVLSALAMVIGIKAFTAFIQRVK